MLLLNCEIKSQDNSTLLIFINKDNPDIAIYIETNIPKIGIYGYNNWLQGPYSTIGKVLWY